MISIVYWPDGWWDYQEQLHEYAHKSDDYTSIEVDEALTPDEIDLLVEEKVK